MITLKFFLFLIFRFRYLINIIKDYHSIPEMFSLVQPAERTIFPELTKKQQKRLVLLSQLTSFISPCLRNRRCLFVSLSIAYWLAGKGFCVYLNVGVTKGVDDGGAHCWLSRQNNESFCELTNLSEKYKTLIAHDESIYYWFDGVES